MQITKIIKLLSQANKVLIVTSELTERTKEKSKTTIMKNHCS